MSKSAREDRPWRYYGPFMLSSPLTAEQIQKQIVKGCTCYGCKANRKHLDWLKQQEWLKEQRKC